MKRRPSWKDRRSEIEERIRSSDRILIASDFDGTLSLLVDHPADAALDAGVAVVISKLIKIPQVTVAFLSGRKLQDLKSRIGQADPRIIFAGNHGFELGNIGPYWLHPAAASARSHLDSLIAGLPSILSHFEGWEIEDKGASVSLHYRRMISEKKEVLRQLILDLKLPVELKLHEGSNVFEFRPNVRWNKGTALRHIMRELDFKDCETFYLGDDVTDEDIFRELDPSAITIHVGRPEKPSSARMNAENPADAAAFLNWILKHSGSHK